MYAEPSLEGCIAQGKAVFVGLSFRFVEVKKSKPVTCMFNITGAKLYMY
jgi:hypothetical protein